MDDEFERYSKVFFKLVHALLTTEKLPDSINAMSESFASFLLTHESSKCKMNGIMFVQDFYKKVWLWISLNLSETCNIEKPLELITRVGDEWYRAFDSLDAEYIEKKGFRFENFSEYVIRDSAFIGYKENGQLLETSAIDTIARSIGRFMDRQHKRGNLVNMKYWQSIVTDRYGYSKQGIPQEVEHYYLKSLASRDFNIAYGFLLSGQLEIIKEGMFLDGVKNIYKIDTYEFAFKIITIHCYMYYLAFRESTNCIEEDLQEKIKELILCDEVANSMAHYIYILAKSVDILNEKMEFELEDYLQHYELFPIHSNVKSMIIESAVRDYYLYIVLMLERHSFKSGLVSKLLNTQTYYTYLRDSDFSQIKKRFCKMHSFFETKKLEKKEAERRSDEMLFSFSKVMKENYKSYKMTEAASIQKNYEKQKVKEKKVSEMKENFVKRFDEVFSMFSEEKGLTKTYDRVRVLGILDHTQWLGEDYRGDYSDGVVYNVMNWIIHELSNEYNVECIDRHSEFETDGDFREYLKNGGYEILLGSQYAFGVNDYTEYELHTDFLNSMITQFNSGGEAGLALKKDTFYIKLNDIYVDITSPEIDDYTFNVDSKTGLYEYSLVDGIILDFKKDELRDYFRDERKVIDVYVNVTIGFDIGENNGVIIKRSY